ncbi:MAG: hypothetical protein HFH53_03640 [Hespellia sp.]|nr:hypothetical protein [Hespellia sp.]
MERRYQQKYPHLFSPVTVRGKRIRNRITAAPHGGKPVMFVSGEEGYSNFSETAAKYYGTLARGGAGIVNTGHLGVDPRYLLGGSKEKFNLFSEETLAQHGEPMLQLMSDYIHAYGAIASLELNHGGLYCTPISEEDMVLGPCTTAIHDFGEIRQVKGMDEAEMKRVAEYFANAARIGKRCGFDAINVHAGHNWLLGIFLSPLDNQRTDQYGGSVENRARFPKMVLDSIRETIGENMILIVRFSASELLRGGVSIEEAVEIAKILGESADIVHCSAGRIRDVETAGFMFPLQYMEHGVNTYLAAEIKKNVPNV